MTPGVKKNITANNMKTFCMVLYVLSFFQFHFDITKYKEKIWVKKKTYVLIIYQNSPMREVKMCVKMATMVILWNLMSHYDDSNVALFGLK